jgi:aminobenzoyl-glutamate transport protein
MFKKKKNRKKRTFSPIYTIWLLSLFIVFLSFVLSSFDFDAQQANIVNLNNPDATYSVELSLITVNNAFSVDGLSFLLKNATTNLEILKPLILLVLSLVGIGIGEASGLFKKIFSPLKKVKLNVLTFGLLFIAIISSFVGDYAYLILLPLSGIIYKYASRNPVLGILTVFVGITSGMGASLLFDYNDLVLGSTTEIAANVQRNINYVYNIGSTVFIKFVSTLILSFGGTYAISKFWFKKYGKKVSLEEEIIEEKTSPYILLLPLLIMLIGIYSIIPNLPFSGILLDNSKELYVDKLMSSTSIFSEGFVYIFSILMMIIGFVYGFFSKTFKDSHDYNLGLSKALERLGPLFVMLFFGLQMIALFQWTNIGNVFIARMIDILGQTQITGLPLIVIFLIVVVISAVLSNNLTANWLLLAPIAIPMFMRSNMTPEYTQYIFSSFSGVGLSFTPLFIYLLISIGFIQKYEDHKVTIFGTLRTIMPVTLFITGMWLIIVLGWYIVGLPLGPSIFPTI